MKASENLGKNVKAWEECHLEKAGLPKPKTDLRFCLSNKYLHKKILKKHGGWVDRVVEG